MEAALASGVLKFAGDKLGQLITGEFASIMGVKKDLYELEGLFVKIKSLLSEVGDRAIESDTRPLKEAAYDIDDLLYEAHMEAEKHKAGIDGAKHKSFVFRRNMAHKIKKIKKRFAAIVRQRSDFNAIVNNLTVDRPDRRNYNTIGEISILGNVHESTIRVRDEEKERIISKLVETNEREKILIVSIVGLGGSGKTTLAKHICEDNKIKEHFQAAIYWVHVSEEFVVPKLIGKLFEAVSEEKSNLASQSRMVKVISDKLSSKKFLLVLDDAWHQDRQDWEQFMGFLNSGAPGSRILLTTRDKRVSEAVKSTNTFDLKPLQPDDSWKFFLQCFGLAEGDMYSEFIEVGKEIVVKCGGVPLAIKTLAGVLCDKREIDAWEAIRDNNLLSEPDIQEKVKGSLMLSYFHLPDDFKQCFVLCSIFPKGYEIDKEQLIDQWIAHDMITLTDGVGYVAKYKKCFNTLVQMSFLQDVTEGIFDGRVKCRMHDLVHDLAQDILDDEISLAVPDKTVEPTKSCRYFSLIEQKGNVPPEHFFEKGRAMYVANGDFMFGKALKSAIYLRSITVHNDHKESVVAAVLQIKNLRYLSISRLKCETLPEVISDIWSLQALHLPDSWLLRELPKSIGKLKKLRTLNLSGCRSLETLPDSIGDCHMISSVDLSHCSKLTALPDSLSGNKNLRVLRLGSAKIELLPSTEIERLPSSITTLGNLEILDLKNCRELVELPNGMTDLKKLKVLNLEGCCKLCGIPVGIEQLSRLQKLGLFVVGEGENFAKIAELGNAGGIGGILTITNIICVKDPDDAEKACLKQKANLQGLTLEWRNEISDLAAANRSNDSIEAEKELAVLDALEPPSGIESIEVFGYRGGQCARWMLKQVGVGEDHPRFPCLTSVRLENFPNLKHLEGLAELPSLRELVLRKMPALESISGGPFPKLEKLEMDGMPNLEEMWMVALADQGEEARSGRQVPNSHLSSLYIWECPKLKVKPYLPSSLKYLWFEDSNEQLPSNEIKRLRLKSGSAGCGRELLQHLTALEDLTISSCHGLTELPWSMRSLTSLLSLRIEWCSSLRVLPEWLEDLRSLQEMTIVGCESLSSLLLPSMQAQHLSASLQVLDISHCDALVQLPECLGDLRSLRHLSIESCDGLSSLPESLGHLTSLHVLYILCCHGLVQLPECLGDLRSLRHLWILMCHGLSSLPESLGHLTSLRHLDINSCRGLSSLPESLGHLTSLHVLEISNCHALVQLPECLGELRSLQHMEVYSCGGLSSLPESLGHLTSLEKLEIRGCDGLSSLPESLGHLTSLQHLKIDYCNGLSSLPESLGHLTSLHVLKISDCDALVQLPECLGHLTSLEELRIESCPRLTSLPEGIQGLTNLQELAIGGCPHLERRCKRVKGKDWHLISHIPHVRID